MLHIVNNGQDIVETNYWDSPHAQNGYFYLAWNAGAGRLLVPDSMAHNLNEMSSADSVVISQGTWHEMQADDALEILWEDGTDSPFAIYLASESTDRRLGRADAGKEYPFSAWTRKGKQREWPAQLRFVDSIPCLQPLDW